jgi:spore germination cell wall hydrolase CwlJ-like protein
MKKLIIILIAFMCGNLNAMTDSDIVTLTILAEARGEGEDGMSAVAQVILNRSRERGISCAKVCVQPWQFSCFNGNKPTIERLNKFKNSHVYEIASHLAASLNFDRDVMPGFTANHYYAHSTIKPPYWAKGQKGVKIKNHTFYTL